MDRLQAMAAFVAVVDSGGFAKAARRLNLSPPVVTRAVAELEARLNLRLLTRTARVVRVTADGQRFADDCRRILADIERAESAAQGDVALAAASAGLGLTRVLSYQAAPWPAASCARCCRRSRRRRCRSTSFMGRAAGRRRRCARSSTWRSRCCVTIPRWRADPS